MTRVKVQQNIISLIYVHDQSFDRIRAHGPHIPRHAHALVQKLGQREHPPYVQHLLGRDAHVTVPTVPPLLPQMRIKASAHMASSNPTLSTGMPVGAHFIASAKITSRFAISTLPASAEAVLARWGLVDLYRSHRFRSLIISSSVCDQPPPPALPPRSLIHPRIKGGMLSAFPYPTIVRAFLQLDGLPAT
jgi:hypothetical protein